MRSRKAILNILVSLAQQVVVIVCGFIVPKLIINEFGSDVNGLVTSITQFLAYISLLEAGFGPVVKAALYKPIAEQQQHNIKNILAASERFFRVISLIFIVYIIILAIVYPIIINEQFAFVYTISLVIIISISTFIEYFFGMTYKLYLQAEQKTYITSIIQIVSYILNTIAIIILVKLNCSIHIVKLVSCFIFILRPLIQNIYVKKKYKLNLKTADKNYKLNQKWDGLAQHVAAVIHDNTDITILTIFTSMTEVSVYSIYYLVVKGIKSIIQSFNGGIDASFGDMIAKNENEHLNKSFKLYELFYYSIVSIVFVCTLILITPFIKVYMKDVTDADYIRPFFGYLLVISEFIWAIRQPYNDITKAVGHFKETKKGAWLETISNIIISIILVFKFGIIGVAIGTLIAMLIRTIEFMYHTNKHILRRSQKQSFIRVEVLILETVIVVLLCNMLPNVKIFSYISWIKYAITVAIIAIIIIVPINLIIYREDAKELFGIMKRILKRKKVKS